MSNKLKRESKKAEQKKQEAEEQQQREAFEAAMKIKNAKYLPEVQVPLSGAEFQQIFHIVERTLREATQTVFDLEGNPLGVTMPDYLGGLNSAMATLMGIHKDNYEKGIAIEHQEYVNIMTARNEKENSASEVDGPHEVPASEGVKQLLEEIEEDVDQVIAEAGSEGLEPPSEESERKVIQLSKE